MAGIRTLVQELRGARFKPDDPPDVRAGAQERRLALAQELLALVAETQPGPEDAKDAALVLTNVWDRPAMEAAVALADRARQAGVDGAGRLYALCVDRLCNLKQQPQRYGSLRWEHNGEMELFPVDGSVTEEECRSLGVQPLAELQAELAAENRRRAAELWAAGGLPEGAEVRRVWRPVDPAELGERLERELGAAGSGPVGAAWAEGDVLVMACRSEAAEIRVVGGIQMPLWRLDGTDLWVLMARVRGLAEAVISYLFVPYVGGEPVWPKPPQYGEWRGPQAPRRLAPAATLAGRCETVSRSSAHLGEARGVTVYIPPGAAGQTLPVIYMADGQSADAYAGVLEPLIVAGELPPVLLVGIHNGARPGGDRRAEEYLPGMSAERFEAHRRFVMEEVLPWVEECFAAAADRERRALFGYSSGATWAVSMGVAHPEVFGGVIAFSVASGPRMEAPTWPEGLAPRHYLVAGTLETTFRQTTAMLAQVLTQAGVPHGHRERVCGHDQIMWQEELPGAVRWLFGRA